MLKPRKPVRQNETIFIWNIPVAQIDVTTTDNIVYLHTDHLGTPRRATNQQGMVVWSWDGDAFGQAAANNNPLNTGSSTIVNLRFAGQYFDDETGLHYNYFRYYDPSSGRYVTSYPIGLDGGLNTFGYVEENPNNYIDPLGLANSGTPIKAPGTNITVKIDNPHVPGQQKHAHIEQGGKEIAINKDGTGSHGNNPDDLTKNKKLREFLKDKGFKLPSIYGTIPFLTPNESYCITFPDSCIPTPPDC